MLPKALHPTSTEVIEIPGTRLVAIPKATPKFHPWHGESIQSSYGGKTVLDLNGEPLFAELAILRLLQSSGWQGAWIDTYRKRALTGLEVRVQLPDRAQTLLNRIRNEAGSPFGCFDVFAWSDESAMFAEAKRLGHDRIRKTQTRWVAAALSIGTPLENLLIVEWSLFDNI